MKIKDGRTTVTSKIAYIAGFFDGEGCVRIKRANQGGNSYYVTTHITNSNLTTLEYIQSLFGGSIMRQERGPNKTVYNLYLSSSEAVDFLTVLSPFLQDKKQQALLAIEYHHRKETLSGGEKMEFDKKMRLLKRVNIYENPKLLEES